MKVKCELSVTFVIHSAHCGAVSVEPSYIILLGTSSTFFFVEAVVEVHNLDLGITVAKLAVLVNIL